MLGAAEGTNGPEYSAYAGGANRALDNGSAATERARAHVDTVRA